MNMSHTPSSEGQALATSIKGHEMIVKQLGLTELYSSQNPEADIVFIHGLGGSPRGTWLYKGNTRKRPSQKPHSRTVVDKLKAKFQRGSRETVFWPADILPQDYENVRILTYGYDADVGRFLSRSVNKLTVSQHGNQFLESIARSRRDARRRPILFVAHDVGGLIVKQALVEAKKQRKSKSPDLHDIYESFQGAIFLGTPHRNTNDSRRALALNGLVKTKVADSNMSAVGSLASRESSMPDDLYNDFCDIIAEEQLIRVSNFQEAKRKPRVLVSTRKVRT
jgi:hypothetical protein